MTHHIGFSGTRAGMSAIQAEKLWLILQHRDFYLHHGDCRGADETADAIARDAKNLRGVVMHPSTETRWRAHCAAYYPHDVVREAKPSLDRNKDIVDESGLLIATPLEDQMILRSGTWSTIRYAHRIGKLTIVILRNGAIWEQGASPPGWYEGYPVYGAAR